jgi:hypothetical protein
VKLSKKKFFFSVAKYFPHIPYVASKNQKNEKLKFVLINSIAILQKNFSWELFLESDIEYKISRPEIFGGHFVYLTLFEQKIAVKFKMVQTKKETFKRKRLHETFSWKQIYNPWKVSILNLLTHGDILVYLLLVWHGFFTCHKWNMREVLVSWWEKWKFFIADFHVLGLFMAKKHDLSDNFFSVCHAPLPLPPPYAKFVPRLQPRP